MRIISNEVFFRHITGENCLEVPERLSLLPKEWFRGGDLEAYKRFEPLLKYAHESDYIEGIKRRCDEIKEGVVKFYEKEGSEIYLCKDSYKVACFAAGYAIEALQSSLDGTPSFAAVRPPGHHAERSVGKGFCIFNNMAIAAMYASHELGKRIFIVDFDIHRGDGTQSIIAGNERIYHASINQEHIYPDTFLDQPRFMNATNINLPRGASEDSHLEIILKKLGEIADSFKPDVIGFSAGFDSCYLDIGWLETPKLMMGKRYFESLRQFAENQNLPYFAVLEGGYNPKSVLFGIKAFACC